MSLAMAAKAAFSACSPSELAFARASACGRASCGWTVENQENLERLIRGRASCPMQRSMQRCRDSAGLIRFVGDWPCLCAFHKSSLQHPMIAWIGAATVTDKHSGAQGLAGAAVAASANGRGLLALAEGLPLDEGLLELRVTHVVEHPGPADAHRQGQAHAHGVLDAVVHG
eukprot:CAMPEP_0179067004 /NCGR_PEP_ID=MMETSP0796-20121207/29268_1 /TAXON_ID=73915 /ORGANISM="Pyrodinium bahamense, Strain pbaha01" /LENGTH=170 /DNA_ID=CAMNT_0020764025 /DNA_START=19 /DNA_END=529 /DNA_ORIENTATION=+